MTGSVFSADWYRIAQLHPRLRSHVRLDRHTYRGQVWHVLRDPISGRHHRLNGLAYQVVGRLDGRLSVQEVWLAAVDQLGDDAPTQPEVLALLGQLHQGELIETEMTPDLARVFEQQADRRREDRTRRMNPIAFRVPLADPTRLLDRLLPFARPLLYRRSLFAWLLLVVVALTVAGSHGREIAGYWTQHIATPRMLFAIWLCYPVIKLLHELAHALAVRAWGGDVREIGVSLLVLMPVPYVDASAASGFRDKSRRMAVSAMGILVETTLACVALLVWTVAADGLIRDMAFATMVIGGLSTLLVNGNPLMRFDAYYILADAIEMPGLGRRAASHLLGLGNRYLLGAPDTLPQPQGSGERAWLVCYGIASVTYRMLITIVIAVWLTTQFVLLGLLFGAWALFSLLLRPLWRLARHVASDPALTGRRLRAVAVATSLAGTAFALLIVVPLPSNTVAEGIVWLPDHARVRSEIEGVVVRLEAADGEWVEAGQPIATLDNPQLLAERDQALAQLENLLALRRSALTRGAVQAQAVDTDVDRLRSQLVLLDDRLGRLTLRGAAAGWLSISRPQDLPGAYLERGATIAHVLSPEAARIRAVLTQSSVGLVRSATRAVEVRLVGTGAQVFPARLIADTPAPTLELPSAALSDRGGGRFAVDPSDVRGMRTLEPVFVVDITLPEQMLRRIGTRAWVRFRHPPETLAVQWSRATRQLFLRLLPGRPIETAAS